MILSEEQKQSLIEDYLNGETWENLCAKYHTNTNTIHKIFNKAGIKRVRMEEKVWSKEKQTLLKEMYLSNRTYKEMYAALDCKGGTLTYWVHKLGLPMRGSGRNLVFDNKFLEDTPESNYWLGYIFADGHISYYEDGRHFGVVLHSEKEYVSKKFKEWFGPSVRLYKKGYKISNGETHYMYNANINSKELSKWFAKTLKVDSRKHHTLNPNIELNWDIIRGYFDGDGSASKGEWQLKSCSKVWLERIQGFLLLYGIKSTLKISYLDCWGLFVRDKENLKKIVPLMYENKYYCHEYKYKLLEPYISNDIVQIG